MQFISYQKTATCYCHESITIRMRLNVFFILCCTLALGTKGQNKPFEKLYDDFNGWEILLSAIELDDSTILLSSSTIDFFADDSTNLTRLYFTKIDEFGNQKDISLDATGGVSLYSISNFRKFAEGYLTVATYTPIDTQEFGDRRFGKVIYFNNVGDTKGSTVLKHPKISDSSPGILPPMILKNNSYVTAAIYNRTYGDSMYLFWNDSLGNVIRVKEYPQIHMSIKKIIETQNKDLLLIGNQFKVTSFIIKDDGLIYNGHPERLWVIKFDSLGNIEWDKLYTGNNYEFYDTIFHRFEIQQQTTFNDVIITSDENYLLAGRVATNPYITKLDPNGQIIWERKYFNDINILDSLRRQASFSKIVEKNGYVYALGQKDSLNTNSNEIVEFYFLMKLTQSGKTIWTRYFEAGINSYLYDLFTIHDGFLLTGSRHDSIPKYGSQDGWMIKLDTNGCLFAGCNNDDIVDTVTAVYQAKQTPMYYNLSVHPNPADKTINLEVQLKEFNCTIYDLTGKRVASKSFDKNETSYSISVETLTDGIYFIIVHCDQNDRNLYRKIVITH
jgi:hypothetical protein